MIRTVRHSLSLLLSLAALALIPAAPTTVNAADSNARMELRRTVIPGKDQHVRIVQPWGEGLLDQTDLASQSFEAPEGGTTLSLHLVPAMPAGETAVIYLESDTLDADVARLKAAGFTFAQDPKDEPWLWREARLADPDGNEICLYHAGENRLNPPWRVKT